MKLKKSIVYVLVAFAIIYLFLAFNSTTNNTVYANTPVPGTLSRDIEGIDDNLYPGYKSLMLELRQKHPNYVFLAYYTGLNWNEVLVTEYQGHGNSPLNLFQVSSNYNGMWQCPICGIRAYDNGSWCCASLEAIAYMMDPRNSLNESDLFQFKDLEGSDVTYDDIARVVANYGSYLNNPEAIQAIVDASKEYNINGYFLVAKVVNEHGKNGSTLSNGQGYNGKYVGYYNYFNIGSYGNGSSTIINNGLSYAQAQGWNSIRASIFGGAQVVKESFITRYSQNTLYYQKFNVSGRSALGSHQYQQNIMAAQSQGTSLKNYYGANSNFEFVFIIPLYNNMPIEPATRPDTTKTNSITYLDGIVQNISSSLTVRASESGTAIGALNNNESIKIIKRGATAIGNYFWDLIVSNVDGTYGYAARYVGGDECIVATGTTGTSSGTANQPTEVTPPAQEPDNKPTENNPAIDTPLEGFDTTKVKVSENKLTVLPTINAETIKSTQKDAIIKDSKGNNVESGNLGTGYKVTIGEKTYTVVKKGDINGDAKVNVVDASLLLNAIKGTKTLENEYKEAAFIKNADKFNVVDASALLNYIKGTLDIKL